MQIPPPARLTADEGDAKDVPRGHAGGRTRGAPRRRPQTSLLPWYEAPGAAPLLVPKEGGPGAMHTGREEVGAVSSRYRTETLGAVHSRPAATHVVPRSADVH